MSGAEDTLLLARTNPHERDARVRFDPEEHKYYVDGAKYPGSVSGLIHDYFPHFDGPAVVEASYAKWAANKENKYNPLIGYLKNVVGLDDELVKGEIVRSWSALGAKASGDGTDTHLQIELALNGEEHAAQSPEFRQFQAWRATHPTWQPYRTEWSVFDEEALICGQIDSVWRDERDGRFYMVDWKRVKEMKTEAFRGERGYEPFHELQNTNRSHYVLQQSAYTWMLEKHYGLAVEKMFLVQVHPDLPSFVEHELPRMTDEVAVVMARRARRVKEGTLAAAPPGAAPAEPQRKRKTDEERRDKLAKHLQKLLSELS